MQYILIVLFILILLAVLYVLSTACSRGKPGLKDLRGWAYAHRGLHGENRPENSMTAFRAALRGGYGIELDVHLLADGNLAVIHDSALERTTGQPGKIEDLTTADLENYYLEGTNQTIPTFSQVLELFDGKAPLIVELKAEGNNHAQLTEAVCKMLDGYQGAYCLESFDPRCVHWLKKNRPELIRGQLTENFLAARKNPLPWIMKLIMTHQMTNFLTRPDFVAYKFADRKTFSNVLVKKLWGTQRVTWTLQTPEEFKIAKEEGWLPIFEGFEP